MRFANKENSSVHRDDTLHADVVGVGLDARWYEGAASSGKGESLSDKEERYCIIMYSLEVKSIVTDVI